VYRPHRLRISALWWPKRFTKTPNANTCFAIYRPPAPDGHADLIGSSAVTGTLNDFTFNFGDADTGLNNTNFALGTWIPDNRKCIFGVKLQAVMVPTKNW
jgi:hypothetical protein